MVIISCGTEIYDYSQFYIDLNYLANLGNKIDYIINLYSQHGDTVQCKFPLRCLHNDFCTIESLKNILDFHTLLLKKEKKEIVFSGEKTQ